MLSRLLSPLLLTMASATHAIEEPRYQVLQSDGAFELRQYEPMLVAHVEVDGDASGARNAGFRLLAGYIFGGNQGVTLTGGPSDFLTQSVHANLRHIEQIEGECFTRWTLSYQKPVEREKV